MGMRSFDDIHVDHSESSGSVKAFQASGPYYVDGLISISKVLGWCSPRERCHASVPPRPEASYGTVPVWRHRMPYPCECCLVSQCTSSPCAETSRYDRPANY